MKNFRMLLAAVTALFISATVHAGGIKEEPEGFKFEDIQVLPATSVKDQHRSGTCWSFSGLSFLESEMLRLGKAEADLSEMFIVYYTYAEKARKNVRLHGEHCFSAGGAFHDVTNMIRKYGIVPEEVYTGLNYGEEKHVHGEMDRVLKEQVDVIIENPNKKLTPVWHDAIVATLDTYLGKIPQNFTYKNKTYTPQSFARDYVGLNMDDYVEITSYTHHPFYSKFIIEIPDNWSWDEVYNVPLNELEEIIDFSLKNGYTVAWAADVSEKGFATSNKGVAVIPAKNPQEMSGAEIARWESLTDKEKEDEIYKLDKPVEEMVITQEMRQVAFDNYQTTDDHGMHIIGTAKDQNGKIYYKVKNSWGNYNKYDGYFYASKAYVNYKTMSIMVHKDGIPHPIKRKLNL